MDTRIFKVDESQAHQRLDIFLVQNLPELPSRTFIKKLLDAGQVTVNKKSVKVHYQVSLGDEIRVEIPDIQKPSGLKAESLDFGVFYEEDSFLVINKPAGMLVHPVPGVSSGTLVNALLGHGTGLSDTDNSLRPGIVHRLDRETSGLMVVAKDAKTHVQLARQFERHLVKKRYVALVHGKIEFEEGLIDAPISRHPVHWDKKAVSYADDAREAVTTYRVLKRYDTPATLVALFPQSGRTHQLRVHMHHLGHPIFGDDKYGSRKHERRMSLHAQALAFLHPRTGRYLGFSCPLPQDFFPQEFS